MDATVAVKKAWAKALKGFYDWLKAEKGFDLPDSGDSLVEEWVESQMVRLGSALSLISDIIGSGPKVPQDEEKI